MFTNHLDFIKVDGTATGDMGSGGTDKHKVVDLSGNTITNAATGLELGGWCVTPGGIASYKMRVTGFNGTFGESELIDWIPGITVTDADGVATQGANRGFGENCRIGARYHGTVDLSAWAGKTINFEIVIVTNYGVEATVIQINNVAVP